MTKIPEIGPIPKGNYYIVDRTHGGRIGWLRELLHNEFNSSDNNFWFALFADDGKFDDYTYVESIRRGNFRLHPIGSLGRSEGCITLPEPKKFFSLRERLLKSKKVFIPGTSIIFYGKIEVK